MGYRQPTDLLGPKVPAKRCEGVLRRSGSEGSASPSGGKTSPKKKRVRGSRRALILERILPIGLLAVALIGAPVMIFSREGMPRLEAVENELQTVERENEELRREIDMLRIRVAKMRDDPATLERIARDELGLIRHTEVVFQFPK